MEIHATKNDLIKSAKNLPIDDIRLWHLKVPLAKIQSAHIVTIRIGREVGVLKDIYGKAQQ